jgi:hypothetical protein
LAEAHRTFLGFIRPEELVDEEDEDEDEDEDEEEDEEEDEDEDEDEDEEDPNFLPHENPFQPNITDNCDRNNKDAEGNPIDGVSYGPLEEGNTLKLSDGYCYDKDTVISLYNRRPFASPFSRELFNEEDIKKAKTVKRAAPVGGSRKKKLNKKKRKTTKKQPKKTRK